MIEVPPTSPQGLVRVCRWRQPLTAAGTKWLHSLGGRPTTGEPFLCLPGIHEYHIHSSHLNDPWENLRPRETYKLRYIIHRVQERFEVTNG